MNTGRILLDQHDSQPLAPKAVEQLLAWGDYRAQTFANFTHEIHDFPNATLSIDIGGSAGRVPQLAGITNVAVSAVSGAIFEPLNVNQVVGTGIFCEGAKPVYAGRTARFITGILGGLQPGYFVGKAVYVSAEPMRLMANVQQITMVEPVDASALIQIAVENQHALLAQLRRIRQLKENWDGEKAPPISERTVEAAEDIIQSIQQVTLAFSTVPKVRVGPLPDGIRFECTHSNKELFLTVSDDTVEAQAWQPLDAVESMGYWKTDVKGARGQLEWLVK